MPPRGLRGGRGACPGHTTARAPSAPAAPHLGWPSLRRAGFGSPSSSWMRNKGGACRESCDGGGGRKKRGKT